MYYGLNSAPSTQNIADMNWMNEVRRLENEGSNVVALTGGQAVSQGSGNMARQELAPSSNELQMQNNLPAETIENPVSREEVYKGSLKAMLQRNIGNYIVATFLVGTQNLTSWEGILYDVGNDYLTIYQAARDRYIVSDIYSLKFIEFYDTERREICDKVLQQTQWRNGGN